MPSIHLLDEIGQKKNFDIYELIKNCEIAQYSKKQARLKNEAIAMPDSVVKAFIDQFKAGDY